MLFRSQVLFLILALVLWRGAGLAAQEAPDSNLIYQFETRDGNAFSGRIVSQTELRYRVDTEAYGLIWIGKDNIRSIRAIEPAEVREGKIWPFNPQASRYFFSPNGYGLRKGEGYYQNVLLVFNQVAFGITDHFSIGAGTVPLFLFGAGETPVWITPKFTIPILPDKLQIGAGILTGVVLGLDNSVFGIPYGIVTIGDRNNNLSLGLGYGFAASEFASTPTVNLNAMFRISPRSYLLTENILFNDGDNSIGVISFGGRSIWTGISLDYGLVVPVSTGEAFIAIPWLGVVIPFGQKNPARALEGG